MNGFGSGGHTTTRLRVAVVVMEAWASSGRGRGMDVCHVSPPCEPPPLPSTKKTQCLSLSCRRGSGHFQGHLQLRGGSCFASRDFPAEGKQMRRNVNRRLLMQHCAKKKKKKMMRPPSLDGLSVIKPPLHPRRRAACSRETEGKAASCSAPRTATQPDRSTPTSTLQCPSLSTHTRRSDSAHALSVLVQV